RMKECMLGWTYPLGVLVAVNYISLTFLFPEWILMKYQQLSELPTISSWIIHVLPALYGTLEFFWMSCGPRSASALLVSLWSTICSASFVWISYGRMLSKD